MSTADQPPPGPHDVEFYTPWRVRWLARRGRVFVHRGDLADALVQAADALVDQAPDAAQALAQIAVHVERTGPAPDS